MVGPAAKKGSAGAKKLQEGARGVLKVTVVDPNDGKKGIEGVSVEVWNLRGGYKLNDKPDKRRKNTGSDGSITFTNIPCVHKNAGGTFKTWDIKLNKENYGPVTKDFSDFRVLQLQHVESEKVMPSATPQDPNAKDRVELTFELTRPSIPKLTVVVKDQDGGVLEGANVEVTGLRGGWDPNGKHPNEVLTDAGGKVVFEPLELTRNAKTFRKLDIKVNMKGYGFLDGGKWTAGQREQVVDVTPGQPKEVVFEGEHALVHEIDDKASITKIIGALPCHPGLCWWDGTSNLPAAELRRTRMQCDVTMNYGETEAEDTPAAAKAFVARVKELGPKPFVIVCGSPAVQLRLEGNAEPEAGEDAAQAKANQWLPADWEVWDSGGNQQNDLITPKRGGNEAELKTTRKGGFTVIAKLNDGWAGWRVSFVKVTVAPKAPTGAGAAWSFSTKDPFGSYDTTGKRHPDMGQPGMPGLGMLSGKGAQDAYVVRATATVEGEGCDKVKVFVLQNGVSTTCKGIYDGGGEVREKMSAPITDTQTNVTAQNSTIASLASGFPILPDHSYDFGTTDYGELFPFPTGKDMWVMNGKKEQAAFQANKGGTRSLQFMDSPGTLFPCAHPNTSAPLTEIRGQMTFALAVVSFSTDWPVCLVAHAEGTWSVEFAGKPSKKDWKSADEWSGAGSRVIPGALTACAPKVPQLVTRHPAYLVTGDSLKVEIV